MRGNPFVCSLAGASALVLWLSIPPSQVIHAQAHAAQHQEAGALIKVVREATERFRDVKVAESEGYELTFGCVSGGEYTGYFPERKRAERRDIKRWSEQLFRFFGLGQGSAELGKFYQIALGEPSGDMKGTYLLVLSPKKRRVKKNVEEVKLWVDAANLLPVRIDYIGKDGGGREIRFLGTRMNPDLSAGLYHVEIPKDVPVSNGFSGLDLSPAKAR